jgi:hypothetical protein
LVSNRAQSLLFEATGMLPAIRHLRNPVLQSESSDFVTIANVIENGIKLPSTPAMSATWAGLRKGFDYYHSNDVSETQATIIMQRVSERQLSKLQVNQN